MVVGWQGGLGRATTTAAPRDNTDLYFGQLGKGQRSLLTLQPCHQDIQGQAAVCTH